MVLRAGACARKDALPLLRAWNSLCLLSGRCFRQPPPNICALHQDSTIAYALRVLCQTLALFGTLLILRGPVHSDQRFGGKSRSRTPELLNTRLASLCHELELHIIPAERNSRPSEWAAGPHLE